MQYLGFAALAPRVRALSTETTPRTVLERARLTVASAGTASLGKPKAAPESLSPMVQSRQPSELPSPCTWITKSQLSVPYSLDCSFGGQASPSGLRLDLHAFRHSFFVLTIGLPH